MIAHPLNPIPESSNLIHLIRLKVATLPPAQQQQILDFVEFLSKKYAVTSAPSESASKTLDESIDECLDALPDDAWDQSPTDGSYFHDHYLTGTPKSE